MFGACWFITRLLNTLVSEVNASAPNSPNDILIESPYIDEMQSEYKE
jgi:hypothetical protein